LRSIGILRLVDENMIEAPIQLVADPVCLRLVAEQICCAADLVVEIDQPFALLGLVPRKSEGTAEPQGGHEPIS